MPIAPEKPFPKMKGHVVRSKDWNELVAEVQRLDAAKVNRAGDVIKGPLTVQDASDVSAAIPVAGTRLHVLEPAGPAVLRIQSGLASGPARLEMWTNPPGSANEWRPGFIQSFDAGDFTGGLSFVTNGSGATQRLAALEAMRLVNGRVGIGVAASPAARLHVADSVSPAVMRLQSTVPSGAARLEMWSDSQGSPNEWRPGYIESFAAGAPGTFTGGLSFFTNGSGAAQRQGAVEAMRLVNGRLGVGVTDPVHKIDVGDRIRLRQGGPASTAGLWLFQTASNADRGFVGMQNDNTLSLWGPGIGWGLNMDVNSGNVGVRANPSSQHALFVNGALHVNGGPLSLSGPLNVSGVLTVTGDAAVSGRVRDQKLRTYHLLANRISLVSSTANETVWQEIPGMNVSLASPAAPGGYTWYIVRFSMNGVATTGVTQAQAEFRILIDGGQWAYTLQEFHTDGWNLRGVSLERYVPLVQGNHTVTVQWSVKSPQARAGVLGGAPEVRATVFGCHNSDFRSLSVFEY
jgi:hypothetical protein